MPIQKNIPQKKLNVNVADAISEFQSVMKEFKLRKDIYRIIFRGKGLEFESYRDFSPDEDASDIDWKASSRAQKLLAKQYKEERDLKIMFLVDVGNNMVFGSGEKLKCEYVTELVAAFSKIILESNDRVGIYLFSDRVKYFISPKLGERHFQFMIDLLSTPKTYGGTTDIDLAIDYAMRYLTSSINSVILISDFLRISKDTEKAIDLLSNRFETVIIRVKDILDLTLPDVEGEIVVESPVNGEQIVVNPKVVKSSYEKYAFEQSKAVEDIFKNSEADYLDLLTNKSFAIPLAMFLKERLDRKAR
ncbi:MAG: DUF58 domain-containing protein [Nanoarchaeota archaeon]